MRFPLDLEAYLTPDDEDAVSRISDTLTQIPFDEHCGAFGVKRAHDVHTGVDLYAPDGAPVYAMQLGVVVDVFPFTGVDANCPWWLDTKAVAIEDDDGVWLYGEIEPDTEIYKGQMVFEGQHIGRVRRVLRNDKGRPVSMLHMERYVRGTREFAPLWELDKPQPPSLIDPTLMLAYFDRGAMWYRKHGQ